MDSAYSRICETLSADARQLAAAVEITREHCRASVQPSLSSLVLALRSIAFSAADLAVRLKQVSGTPANVQPVQDFVPQCKKSCNAAMAEIRKRIETSQTAWKLAIAGGAKRVWVGRKVEGAIEKLSEQNTKLELYVAVLERNDEKSARVHTTESNHPDQSQGRTAPETEQSTVSNYSRSPSPDEEQGPTSLSRLKRISIIRRFSLKPKTDHNDHTDISPPSTGALPSIHESIEPAETATFKDTAPPSTATSTNHMSTSSISNRVTFSVPPSELSPELRPARRLSKRHARRRSELLPKSSAHLAHFLNQSIMARDVEHVSSLICQGADVNFADPHGHTPLHIACGVAYPAVNWNALAGGGGGGGGSSSDASSSSQDPGEEALAEMLTTGEPPSLEILDLLLDFGAHVNRYDNAGRSALLYACLGLHLPLVRSLVKRGAKVRSREFDLIAAAPHRPSSCYASSYTAEEVARNRELICHLLRKSVLEDVRKRQSLRSEMEEGRVSAAGAVRGFRWSNISGGWVVEKGDGVGSRIFVSPNADKILRGEELHDEGLLKGEE